jgi:O-antigen ligase
MSSDFNIDKVYQFLIIILAFLMPLTVFGANLIIVIICILWLFSGDYKSKFQIIISNKLLIASIVFFFIHVIGLLWTEDLIWGLHIIHKMWYFILFFPILFTITRRRYVKYYITAFLLAVTVTEISSYLVWFELVDPFRGATVENPTPFMSHISYNPILAFAIYLISHEVLFNTDMPLFKKYLYSLFTITMTINMFITGGRAGQVMFFAMISILILQYFNSQKFKAILVISIIIPSIFITAYQASSIFQLRVDQGFKTVMNYSGNWESSLGNRIGWTINSWSIILDNPIIGVGTGDFPTEYKKASDKIHHIPISSWNTTNPHNMYILILVQLGLLGLVSFLAIFYYQIKWSFQSNNKYIRDIGITLPLLFLLIMWSDSYLLGHFTTLVYVFFSSFLYKDFEKS